METLNKVLRTELFLTDMFQLCLTNWYQYRRPSLFADFLSANSLIHIGKKNIILQSKMDFICEFMIRGLKWQNVSTANNKGNLYHMSTSLLKIIMSCWWPFNDCINAFIIYFVFNVCMFFQSTAKRLRATSLFTTIHCLKTEFFGEIQIILLKDIIIAY